MNANEVLKKYYGDGTFPIDLEYIAASVGIEVEYIGREDSYCGELDTDVDPIVIKINRNHAETRQRFTFAHELGHYFLDHGSRNRIVDNRSSMFSYDPIEYMANDFASKLLMPSIFIDYLMENNRGRTLSSFAREFNVSEDAARIRCKKLGML